MKCTRYLHVISTYRTSEFTGNSDYPYSDNRTLYCTQDTKIQGDFWLLKREVLFLTIGKWTKTVLFFVFKEKRCCATTKWQNQVIDRHIYNNLKKKILRLIWHEPISQEYPVRNVTLSTALYHLFVGIKSTCGCVIRHLHQWWRQLGIQPPPPPPHPHPHPTKPKTCFGKSRARKCYMCCCFFGGEMEF